MPTSPDFGELLELFDEHEVRYLIVGGYAARPRRETVMIGDTPMHFIGREDLIASKRAAGRPKDLLDLEALETDL